MSFFLRVLTFPPLNQIVAVPQIVVVDQTGPAIVFGTKPGAACLVGEFIAGGFGPTEVSSGGDVQAQFTADGTIYKYLSQSAAGVQDGTEIAYNGNGMLQLLGRTFQRLVIVRVDHEAVTTDGGTTKAVLAVTVTVAATDQDGSSNTNKDIIIPAGKLFGSSSTLAASTRVFAASGNFRIAKGTALTANAVTVNVPCFPVRVIEPVVATAIAAISNVLDASLPNVATGTTITGVNNATALWPAGTGTSLATRIESRYAPAITKTLPGGQVPVNEISIIWAARRTSTIRQNLATNAISASEMGRGRIACVSAEPAAGTLASDATTAKTAAIGLAASDNYVQPADRVIITFPQVKVKVPDFGNIAVAIDGSGAMASTLANFAEEVNPGAANPYIQNIESMEDCFVANPLTKTDYINLIAAGVCAFYRDTTAGWQFMQGVTAANPASFSTRTPIKRRRMADLIQDTLAQIASPYHKQPATDENVDAYVGEIEGFLESLLSTEQPALQRIVGYDVDADSGNTQDMKDLGIRVVIVRVKTLASLDFPVFVTQIGETVVIPVQQVQAAA
jgi:hypothetical protein